MNVLVFGLLLVTPLRSRATISWTSRQGVTNSRLVRSESGSYQEENVGQWIAGKRWDQNCWKEAMCAQQIDCKFEGPGILCGLERDTQRQIIEYMSSSSNVLEVGSRYGTVSCAISKRQKFSGARLSVEPDAIALQSLNANVKRNACAGIQVHGVVSKTPASQPGSGYGVAAVPDLKGTIPNFSVNELEKQLGDHLGRAAPFDTLFVDCEGCFFNFIKEQSDFLRSEHLKQVFLEADIEKWDVYKKDILPKMCELGFEVQADEINTTCCPDIHHLVFRRGGKCAKK